MPKPITRQLSECECLAGSTVGDEPVVKRVKVLGLESANGRRYTLDAMRGAVELYNGARVNIDHPARPHDSRTYRDRFGKLANITVESDGMYGDLPYNPKHALAGQFAWDAAHEPESVGLSHNAVGQGHDEDGVFVVDKILSLRSVDLVADPATVRSLFESKQAMRIKLGKFFESAKWESRTGPRIQATIKRLFEDDMMDPETEMDGEDGPDHHTALKQGFRAACGAVLDDDTMDADAKCKRLSKLLKAHEKLSGDMVQDDEEDDEEPEESEDEEEGDGDPREEDKDEDKEEYDERDEECKMEGVNLKALPKEQRKAVVKMARRLDTLEAKDRVAAKRNEAERLIKECRLPAAAVSEVFLEELLEATDAKRMRTLIEDRKKIAGIRTPVSAGSGSGGATISNEEFKRRLTAGHR